MNYQSQLLHHSKKRHKFKKLTNIQLYLKRATVMFKKLKRIFFNQNPNNVTVHTTIQMHCNLTNKNNVQSMISYDPNLKVKAKFIKHHAMKTYTCMGGVQVTSALDGGKSSTSHLCQFTPTKRIPSTHCRGGWVGPSAGLDVMAKRKISCPCRGYNSDTFGSFQLNPE
jgi:hypothetical protein